MKRIIKDYFSFTRRERTAIVILLVLMAAFIAAPYLYQPAFEPPEMNSRLAEFVATNSTDSAEEKLSGLPSTRSSSPALLFPFDPNSLDQAGWIKLGISERTTHTILNYRNKGGRFRSPSDLYKIWGIKPADAERLVPFARIAEKEVRSFIGAKRENTIGKISERLPAIDINAAGVEEWKSLPGIGEVLATRIVKYRERLGGFLSVGEVRKTYGISDSLYEKISSHLHFNPNSLPRLNINTASLYELRVKLGIPYGVAKTIVANREQRGAYHSLEEIKNIAGFGDSSWQKLLMIGIVE